MTKERSNDELRQQIGQRIRTFSRVQRVFYLTVVVCVLVLATSAIYLNIRGLQIQQDISLINDEIEAEKVALNDVKQEVNELTRLDRITEIINRVDIKTQTGNLEKVE